MTRCPKCGARPSRGVSQSIPPVVYACGAWVTANGDLQQPALCAERENARRLGQLEALSLVRESLIRDEDEPQYWVKGFARRVRRRLARKRRSG